MKSVNTTLGMLDVDQLGAVDVHEHVIIDSAGNPRIPEGFHHIEPKKIAAECSAWKRAGGGLIIDSSPIGAGRNIELLERTSRIADLPIMASSGFHKSSYYSGNHWLSSKSESEIYQILVDECKQGILIDDHHPEISQRHSVTAGILKIGVDSEGVTPLFMKITAAAGKAINTTGLNGMIHTEPSVPFAELVRHLDRFQIPPHKIMLCHMGKSLDAKLHHLLAREGFYLEFDEMVRHTPTLDELAEAILDLFNLGYGHAVLFAGDLARRSYWACYGGKPGLPYLITGLRDDLIARGLTPEMLEEVWVHNPRRFFGD